MPLIQGPVAFTTVRASTESVSPDRRSRTRRRARGRHVAQRDHLRVVRDRAAGVGSRPDVGEAEPPVVRERVDVDAAAAQALEPEVGNALQRTRGREQATEPVARQPRVEREPQPERRRPVGAVTVEREQERQPSNEVRRHGLQERASLAMRLANELDVTQASGGSAGRRGSASTKHSKVAPPKSARSTSATARPACAASFAIPAPTMPPPITRRSNRRSASCERSLTAGSSTRGCPSRRSPRCGRSPRRRAAAAARA